MVLPETQEILSTLRLDEDEDKVEMQEGLTPCHIHRLPTEVMREIFLALLLLPNRMVFLPGDNRHSWVLQVCKRWREIALDLAALWTNVGWWPDQNRVSTQDVFAFCRGPDPSDFNVELVAHRMEEWVARAKGLPLNVAIINETPGYNAAWEPLTRRASTWATFQYRGLYSNGRGFLYDVLNSGLKNNDKIWDLILVMTYDIDDDDDILHTYPFYVQRESDQDAILCLPNLRWLSIVGMIPTLWQLQAPNLTYLSLGECKMPISTLTEAAQLFPLLFALELLDSRVYNNGEDTATPSRGGSTIFPTLKLVIMTNCFTNNLQQNDFDISFLWQAPCLTNLTITPQFLHLIPASILKNIEEIELLEAFVSADKMRVGLQKLSKVKVINMRNMTVLEPEPSDMIYLPRSDSSNILEALRPLSNTGLPIPCPHLEDLVVSYTRVDFRLLITLIRERESRDDCCSIDVSLHNCYNTSKTTLAGIEDIEKELDNEKANEAEDAKSVANRSEDSDSSLED